VEADDTFTMLQETYFLNHQMVHCLTLTLTAYEIFSELNLFRKVQSIDHLNLLKEQSINHSYWYIL
jgi:hypothetical protein